MATTYRLARPDGAVSRPQLVDQLTLQHVPKPNHRRVVGLHQPPVSPTNASLFQNTRLSVTIQQIQSGLLQSRSIGLLHWAVFRYRFMAHDVRRCPWLGHPFSGWHGRTGCELGRYVRRPPRAQLCHFREERNVCRHQRLSRPSARHSLLQSQGPQF
eukprot:SAG31_NODE_663_length_13021_cov_9.408296_9_plen_157_part_00